MRWMRLIRSWGGSPAAELRRKRCQRLAADLPRREQDRQIRPVKPHGAIAKQLVPIASVERFGERRAEAPRGIKVRIGGSAALQEMKDQARLRYVAQREFQAVMAMVDDGIVHRLEWQPVQLEHHKDRAGPQPDDVIGEVIAPRHVFGE